ncbi:CDF family Co(II)/Ni(II) efflux transporter DmeF [Ferribacterium limneticum]|uniref:CDF family Co(II)/Ni(II) efflux transporter DmeF n=1 Tax=Ferribacterium limneticum TaxID=76259 RepID=UPI001CFABDAA|nr:CDF family Co(II)/Ni(II) efflux transporter DmeF [Ferribacterium limneticum]UCV29311.1 CDF family Co(II)/Ni(II) efflux transporter DmeF [Ferribacterium limneticum]UCV33230.1 CDF family Co(II)/Ni(II) efflux transporter DmeF [Ferribacterium limneticum]
MSQPQHDISRWAHQHQYSTGNAAAERGTRLVMWITIATMLVEILAGWWFNSMAVLADGWHMSSHALAIGLSAFAYAAARKYAADPSFAFGTWKIEVLASYTSAIFLLGVAAAMVFGSLERLWSPQTIHYPEAMGVAILGLAVNLVCALILGKAHDHGHHHHHHGDDHAHHHHHDLNLKAAYIHVITDAMTSVLAIAALAGGWFYGWAWLDPATGLVGAVLVALWAKNLIVQSSHVLLDREMDHPVVAEIREVIGQLPQAGNTQLTDLHVWRVGNGAYACALSLLTHDQALTPLQVRSALGIHEEIVHATVEIHRCDVCQGTAD